MWAWIAVFVVALFLAYKNMPKPQNQKPAELEDGDRPTTSEAKPIPVLFGSRIIRDPNLVFRGDISARAIRKKGGKK